MRISTLVALLSFALATSASAVGVSRTVTGPGTFACDSITCTGGSAAISGGGTPDVQDIYTTSGAVTVSSTAASATRTGILLTGVGGLTVGSGSTLVASVPTDGRNSVIQVGTGGLTVNNAGTIQTQGGWLPTYSSTQTAILAARPANPMVVPSKVEFPSVSVMRIWFGRSDATGAKPTVNRAHGTTGDAYILAYLEAIQRYGDSDSAGTPRFDRDILFEIYDPYPDKFISGSPWARYRILHAECNAALLGTCNNVAASWIDSAGAAVTASATTDLGFIDVSMRQFTGDYPGLDPAVQDSVTGTIAADINPGQRCINIGANYDIKSGADLRPRDMQWAGWWLTLENASDDAKPTRSNSYAIGKSMDSTSPMAGATATDWVCVADINGIRDKHVAATATENAFRIHRGVFPGDNWYAQVPVTIRKNPAAAARTVDIQLNGTTTMDATYIAGYKHIGIGTTSDRPDADVVFTNMTTVDCEAAGGANGGECISAFNVESGNVSTTLQLNTSGLSAAGGGSCFDDTAAPLCTTPAGDGDVHFTQMYNFPFWDSSRSVIRWPRDDAYYKPANSGAGVSTMLASAYKAWYVEASDAIDGSFGTNTGNMFDAGIGGSPTAGQYSDTAMSIKGAVCANCTTDDGAPQFSIWNDNTTTGSRTSGSITESGCLGCVGGGGFNDIVSASYAANVVNYISLMGTTARLTNLTFGGASLTPPNANGVFVGEVGNLGGTPNQLFYLWPRSANPVSMKRVYLRDIALINTGPRSGHLPNGGVMKDILTVNIDASRLMSTELVTNTAINPMLVSNITLAETNDFDSTLAATRWGTGANGLFIGTPGSRSAAFFFTAFFGLPTGPNRHAALTLKDVLITNYNNGSEALDFQNVESVPTGAVFSGKMCFYNNNNQDMDATLITDALSDGASFIRDRGVDAIDPNRGLFSTPGYYAQYGCGISKPVGVCTPTYYTRRYNLDPSQFCSAGWAYTPSQGGLSLDSCIGVDCGGIGN